jgi:putative transposase
LALPIFAHFESGRKRFFSSLLTTAINSPQSNGMAESFVKTFKRDYVTRMDRRDDPAVMRQLRAAFEHYNEVQPHSALKMLSPRMFRRKARQLSEVACPVT